MFNHVHYAERQNTVCFAGHPMFDDKLGHSKIPNAGPKFFTTNIIVMIWYTGYTVVV